MTTTHPIKSPRKLIEVALPLDAINAASAKEKSIRHGHPSSLHLWWARRPLATARAVIFAQLVNDPGYQQGGGFKYGKNKKEAAIERQRLFKIIEDLVLFENSANEELLESARVEIRRSWREVCDLNHDHPQAAELFNPDKMPALHDPFAGGGAIPLEAQRLGLEAHASDLNPVAVVINKAMIEIPPRFVGVTPIGPIPSSQKQSEFRSDWPGATGIAEDVRRYGAWMHDEARNRLGHLYPPIEITPEMAKERPDLKPLAGQKLTVIAWLWARAVKSPNPAFSHVQVPLAASFVVSSKAGKEAWIEPVLKGDSFHFKVRVGSPPAHADEGTRIARGSFRCVLSNAPIPYAYVDDEANAGRMTSRLMAVVCEGPKGRVYLSPDHQSEVLAKSAVPAWKPDTPCRGTFASNAQGRIYGFKVFGDYFSPRQLVALNTYCELLEEVRERIRKDASSSGMSNDEGGLESGGRGATAYAEAVSVYLAFAIDKMADLGNSLVRWEPIAQCPRQLFGRQAIPMVWDYAEANPLCNSSGSWHVLVDGLTKALAKVFEQTQDWFVGSVSQADAQSQQVSTGKFVSSDPPYYDNIGYADLSDFFYVWLRRTLRGVFPNLLATISVPKSEELVATPYRHGGQEEAEAFFLDGMTKAMGSLAQQAHPEGPITIYYAFKQAETQEGEGTVSAGWVTFLSAVIRAGLQLTGTWPMRTENASRMVGQGTNALASCIVLVCRKRAADAPMISRRDFIRELNGVLPEALDEMTKGTGSEGSPVTPVDLSQAIIGPGMAVFSKYASVLEADGSAMSVRTALQLINRFLAEDDFDADTQFCLHWFEQNGWKEGKFGDADTLARAKATSVNGAVESGVVHSGGGKVRLVKFGDYPTDWDPQKDKRLPIWEVLHHLIRALKQDGERGAGRLLAVVKAKAEPARQLAYRLYTLCERQGWAEDARAYNELITSWTAIESAAGEVQVKEQPTLFGETR